jgi:multiple sugar transport system substrate-binding protein
MIPKTVAALDSGSPPDVAYADTYDFQTTASWAYDGKLEDISSVINPHHWAFCAEYGRNHFLVEQQRKQACVLRFPDQAADHAHPVLG